MNACTTNCTTTTTLRYCTATTVLGTGTLEDRAAVLVVHVQYYVLVHVGIRVYLVV